MQQRVSDREYCLSSAIAQQLTCTYADKPTPCVHFYLSDCRDKETCRKSHSWGMTLYDRLRFRMEQDKCHQDSNGELHASAQDSTCVSLACHCIQNTVVGGISIANVIENTRVTRKSSNVRPHFYYQLREYCITEDFWLLL
jgi:hypothetical protein